MSRKSRSGAPGIDLACQVRPPSVVRSTVAWVPLAQTTRESTTQRPRSRALVPLTWMVHWAWDDSPDKVTASRAIPTKLTRGRSDKGDIDHLRSRDPIRWESSLLNPVLVASEWDE